MTNKDKFLRDGVSVEELGKGIDTIYLSDDNIANIEQATIKFFSQEVKPTLTEDERVILRNLEPKMWNTILREEDGNIAFGYKLSKRYRSLGRCEFYNHLFQFIKERRRIRNKGVVI